MAKRKNNVGTVKKKQITEKNLKANRNYKDTVFRMLFSDRKNIPPRPFSTTSRSKEDAAGRTRSAILLESEKNKSTFT